MRGVLGLVAAVVATAAGGAVPAERDPTDLGVPFERWSVADALGRRITFYLSRAPSPAPGPLVVLVQGSGCTSLFRQRGDRVTGGHQSLLRQAVAGRARVLAVEKPGVRYLDDRPERPGEAAGCSREFLEEHTLPRWAAAIEAAVAAARGLPGIDASRTLVTGHSEGGLVAARVAADDPRVTHVASLAGGGPRALFDLAEAARRRAAPGEAEARVAEIYRQWALVLADPERADRFFLGHPYRRWSSFLRTSVLEELARTPARVYLAHGTEDAAVPVAAFDLLLAELRARGRDVTAERLAGADHGFARPGDGGGAAGMQALLGRVAGWFLDGQPGAGPTGGGAR